MLQAHRDQVRSVAFSPDGTVLATSGDQTVRLSDVGEGRLVRALQVLAAQQDWGRPDAGSVTFSPDGRLLASAGADGSVRLWEVGSGALTCILMALADGWACLTPHGDYKVEGATSGQIWFAAALCRFEPGELDPYMPALRRLPLDVPLAAPARHRQP